MFYLTKFTETKQEICHINPLTSRIYMRTWCAPVQTDIRCL